MPETRTTDDLNDPAKKAVDAYGGDPMQPNDAMLTLISEAAESGKKDEAVTRWANAFKAVCSEPVTPDALLLDGLAEAVVSGKKIDSEKLLEGAPEAPVPVHARLAALKSKEK
jgi:hypothetical protein